MEPSIEIKPTSEFFEAFSLAQAKVVTITRTGVGDSGYTFSYIHEIMDYLRPILGEFGLTMIQSPVGKNKLVTVVTHKSGGYMSWAFDLPPYYDPMLTASQAWSAAITKARKTACKTIFNITDKDDYSEKDGADAGAKMDIASELGDWVDKQIAKAAKSGQWSGLISYFKDQFNGDQKALSFALAKIETAAQAAGVQITI